MEDLHRKIIDAIVSDEFDQRIMSNLTRPLYVERMVAFLLGDEWKYVGANWSGWDIENVNNGIRIEVKQSAARQVWTGRPSLGGRPTRGSFDIAPKGGYYTEDGKKYVKSPGRPADLYIFAWHPISEEAEADHRDLPQWQFFVVPKSVLPPGQKTMGLGRVKRLSDPVSAGELSESVRRTISGWKSRR